MDAFIISNHGTRKSRKRSSRQSGAFCQNWLLFTCISLHAVQENVKAVSTWSDCVMKASVSLAFVSLSGVTREGVHLDERIVPAVI